MTAEIQKSIYATLTGSAELVEAVTGIYDHAPDDCALPVVEIGNGTHVDAGTKTDDLIDYSATINVYAGALSFASVRLIQDKIRAALHRQVLAVDEGQIIHCFETFSDVIPQPDGETLGVQRFQILYQY